MHALLHCRLTGRSSRRAADGARLSGRVVGRSGVPEKVEQRSVYQALAWGLWLPLLVMAVALRTIVTWVPEPEVLARRDVLTVGFAGAAVGAFIVRVHRVPGAIWWGGSAMLMASVVLIVGILCGWWW